MSVNGIQSGNTNVKPPTTNLVAAAEERGANSDRAAAFVAAAEKFIGQPYQWGGGHQADKPGVQPVDASGLVGQAAGMVGANLSGPATELAQKGQRVSKDALQAGDLVLRDNPGGGMHVGVYDGKGNVIQASHSGESVRSEPYQASEWTQAVRPWLGQSSSPGNPSPPSPTADRNADAARVTSPTPGKPPASFDF